MDTKNSVYPTPGNHYQNPYDTTTKRRRDYNSLSYFAANFKDLHDQFKYTDYVVTKGLVKSYLFLSGGDVHTITPGMVEKYQTKHGARLKTWVKEAVRKGCATIVDHMVYHLNELQHTEIKAERSDWEDRGVPDQRDDVHSIFVPNEQVVKNMLHLQSKNLNRDSRDLELSKILDIYRFEATKPDGRVLGGFRIDRRIFLQCVTNVLGCYVPQEDPFDKVYQILTYMLRYYEELYGTTSKPHKKTEQYHAEIMTEFSIDVPDVTDTVALLLPLSTKVARVGQDTSYKLTEKAKKVLTFLTNPYRDIR